MFNGNLALAINQDETHAFSEKQIAILTELKAIYLKYANGATSYLVTNYSNFYWDELTDLAQICDYVRYTPPAATNMWLSGRHDIMASIATWEVPTPALSIVPKSPVCPSALREPAIVFVSATGRRFEALEYSTERRVFMALDNAVTYCMEVVVERIGENAIATISTLNGRTVSRLEWLIDARFVGRSFRYLENEQQAVAGAYDFMQAMVMSGKV
jgi:hypothetical protein